MAYCKRFKIRDFFGWLFFLGNFALIGIGLTLLVIGSYAQITVSNYLIFLNDPYIKMIPIFMMVIGAVVLVTCIALCSTLTYFMSKYEEFLQDGDFFSYQLPDLIDIDDDDDDESRRGRRLSCFFWTYGSFLILITLMFSSLLFLIIFHKVSF